LGAYDDVVFLLVTGASGAGKSTARQSIADELKPGVKCVELHDVVQVPRVPTKAWRQEATEAVVRLALALQAQGRDLLLAGDPVAAGELIAAPSADQLDSVAVCLLDVDQEAQFARLSARGDDPASFVHHVAFADWMRGHAADPVHRLEVLRTAGWEQMRWARCSALADRGGWTINVLDTSSLDADAVATGLLAWCRRALSGQAPAMRVGS
jgi:hypothetical protein